MDSKPALEQFIQNFFHERTDALKRRLEIHRVYRKRFYHDDCAFDSRQGVIERSEAEQIVSVTPTATGASIVTTGETIYGSRYHLTSSGESWLIQEVDMECAFCRVKGMSSGCSQCGGTGWLAWNSMISLHRSKRRKALATVVTEEELRDRHFSDAGLEEYMAEHLRERTRARRKEFEVQNNFTRRFFSPACDSTRWGPSVAESEAETVLDVETVDAGVRVITSGLHIMRLRYHLRPTGQCWLIWDVDTECIICCQQGRNANCFLCGGTIWSKKFSRADEPSG